MRKHFGSRSGWRTGLLAVAGAAAVGVGVGSVPGVAGNILGSAPDPRDVAAPPGPPGAPGSLIEVRECPGLNGTTNIVFLTLAPKDTPVSENAGPVVPANLPCGPEDRVR